MHSKEVLAGWLGDYRKAMSKCIANNSSGTAKDVDFFYYDKEYNSEAAVKSKERIAPQQRREGLPKSSSAGTKIR